MVADPKPMLACLAQDHTNDGRSIIGLGPVPFACIGPSAWWIAGVAMGRAFLPRILVPVIGLTGRATPCLGRSGLVQVGLNILPQGMELFP